MSKQIQEPTSSPRRAPPVGKAPRGMFKNVRPDDLLAHVLKRRLGACAGDRSRSGSTTSIVGCAMPEAEQGMNVARIGLLLAGLPDTVPRHDHQPLLLVRRAGGGAWPPTASAWARPMS